MCAAAQTANRGQEGGGAGHAGRGRNAARWLSSLRALLLCWLPAALLHWRHAQRALASELSSGMPDDHDTALHSTRVQPIRPINLARAGADGPEPRRQVHLHCAFEAFPQSSFGFRDNSYVVERFRSVVGGLSRLGVSAPSPARGAAPRARRTTTPRRGFRCGGIQMIRATNQGQR